MLNFTVGPVQSPEDVLKLGCQQLPYFRTQEFSKINKENELLFLKFLQAKDDARAVFITGSGTAAMEASVINLFDERDKLLVINGGGFGQRFSDICFVHHIPYDEIKLEKGRTITRDQLYGYDGNKYTGMLVNMLETTTGVLYDIEMISKYCQKYGLFLVVDAISSFLADPLYMSKWGIDIVFTGSQKALALPPGLSIIAMSKRAVDKIQKKEINSYYLDLKNYLEDGERGQTPFTPAVGVILQLNLRLKRIDEQGFEKERKRIEMIAKDFRERVKCLPFHFFSNSMSNAVTPLVSNNGLSSYDIFIKLKNEYDIFVCPNGGDLSDLIFRVGHIGDLTVEDNIKLINALNKIVEE